MLPRSLRWAVGCAILLIWTGSACAHALLADAPDNKAWLEAEKTGEVVLLSSDTRQSARLVLSKAALRDATTATLTIETDARALVLRSGDIVMNLPSPSSRPSTAPSSAVASPLKLTLDAGADGPRLLINGENSAALRGKWSRICLDQTKATLTLELSSVSYATIKLGGLPEGLEVRSARAATGPSATTRPASPSAWPDDREAVVMLKRLRSGVCELTMTDADGKECAVGTAFLIAADGRALTNFHIVAGANGGTAKFPDLQRALPVELLEADPSLDLALIQVSLGDVPPNQRPVVLELTDEAPAVSDPLWALGYPLGLGFTVNKGIAHAIRPVEDLPAEFDDMRKTCAPASQWLQTSCTINHGNSGGPLVNAQGRVVGISTWSWPMGDNLYFALLASQAKALAQAAVSTPLTFAGAKEKYKDSIKLFTCEIGDVPTIVVAPVTPVAQVAAAARMLRSESARMCTTCRGSGTVRKSVPVGSRSLLTRPDIKFNVNRYLTFPCDRCNGAGQFSVPDADVGRLAATFVSKLASVKPAEATYQEQTKAAQDVIAQLLLDRPSVQDAITRAMRGQTGQKDLKPGTPIAIAGRLYAWTETRRRGEPIYYVAIQGSGETIAVIKPILTDSSRIGNVLVGGVYAGSFTAPDGEPVKLLQNGFIFTAP